MAQKIEQNNTEREKIEEIEGLSPQTGLDRVFGRWDVYKKSLKLSIKEIVKCDENLNEFLASDDMRNFSIEAHSMKGLLANIGASGLSNLALELEDASNRKDTAFCISALPPFLKALRGFGRSLEEVFPKENKNSGPVEIPQELPVIFDKLKIAFSDSDFSAIDKEMENLEKLNTDSALEEELDKIKDAVMMMDYDSALSVMQNLLRVLHRG